MDNPTNVTFKITDTKLYAPVVTWSTENDESFLGLLRTGFKRILNGINISQKWLSDLK